MSREKKEPGTHCLHMLSSPWISGNFGNFHKIFTVIQTSARHADFFCVKDTWLPLTMLCVDDDKGVMKAVSSLLTGIIYPSVPAECYGMECIKIQCLKFNGKGRVYRECNGYSYWIQLELNFVSKFRIISWKDHTDSITDFQVQIPYSSSSWNVSTRTPSVWFHALSLYIYKYIFRNRTVFNFTFTSTWLLRNVRGISFPLTLSERLSNKLYRVHVSDQRS